MNHNTNSMLILLSDMEEEITSLLDQAETIITRINEEESIESFESTYCTNCERNCGRTNAEIYNCIIDRMNQIKEVEDQYKKQQYSKEYLERDLQKIKQDLENMKKNIRKTIETYESKK